MCSLEREECIFKHRNPQIPCIFPVSREFSRRRVSTTLRTPPYFQQVTDQQITTNHFQFTTALEWRIARPLSGLAPSHRSQRRRRRSELCGCPNVALTSAGRQSLFPPRPAMNDSYDAVSAFRVSQYPPGFRPLETPSTPRVGNGQTSQFDRTSEYPVAVARKLCTLTPAFEYLKHSRVD
jgi:hypothetical protein